MFKKVLIANRGEIAVRAIRACKEMGIETVAVYSKADEQSLHVRYADNAICIGDSKASKSYLYIYNIFGAAESMKVDAIYPGTGFFSENPTFVKMCEQYNATFIGAKSDVIQMLTSKIKAKEIAREVGIPVVEASENEVADSKECLKIAERIGFPVMLKAVDGGGGKGMRIVEKAEDIESAFESCREEAKLFFKSTKIFVEKYVSNARHVEVQVLSDTYGNAIHLLDRDCTMQRRNQKLIEEAVSVFVPKEVKERMYADAIGIIKHINYAGAATVEFLVDKDMNYYFMEVNPRVQVEHTITEQVTGVDIVKEQIRIAAGEKLNHASALGTNLHSIECRINAEDSSSNFMCSTGTVKKCVFPRGAGVRIESHICEGFKVTPYYDSMIAKIIVTAENRNTAINKMRMALDEMIIEGVNTNADLQKKLISTPEFINGTSTTSFAGDYIKNCLNC